MIGCAPPLPSQAGDYLHSLTTDHPPTDILTNQSCSVPPTDHSPLHNFGHTQRFHLYHTLDHLLPLVERMLTASHPLLVEGSVVLLYLLAGYILLLPYCSQLSRYFPNEVDPYTTARLQQTYSTVGLPYSRPNLQTHQKLTFRH